MKVAIFYSLQSDLSLKTNRYYIEDAIKKALKKLTKIIKLLLILTETQRMN